MVACSSPDACAHFQSSVVRRCLVEDFLQSLCRQSTFWARTANIKNMPSASPWSRPSHNAPKPCGTGGVLPAQPLAQARFCGGRSGGGLRNSIGLAVNADDGVCLYALQGS